MSTLYAQPYKLDTVEVLEIPCFEAGAILCARSAGHVARDLVYGWPFGK